MLFPRFLKPACPRMLSNPRNKTKDMKRTARQNQKKKKYPNYPAERTAPALLCIHSRSAVRNNFFPFRSICAQTPILSCGLRFHKSLKKQGRDRGQGSVYLSMIKSFEDFPTFATTHDPRPTTIDQHQIKMNRCRESSL